MLSDLFFPVSRIDDPVLPDDRYARRWYEMRYDLARLEDASALSFGWLHELFDWGPISWPVRWSDLIQTKEIDCGVFADLSEHLLRRAGVLCGRVQQLMPASVAERASWREKWEKGRLPDARWILSNGFVYHEMLVVVLDGYARLFDTTDDCLIDLEQPVGHEREYYRLCEQMPSSIVWESRELRLGEWIEVRR